MRKSETPFESEAQFQEWENRRYKGRILGGIALIITGVLVWCNHAGLFALPSWLFSWKTFLIALGLIIGIKHNFQKKQAFILIAIGAFFLLLDILASLHLKLYIIPALLILAGSIFIFKSTKKYHTLK